MRDVFGRLWAVWALIVFLPSMFIAMIFYIPCFFLKEPLKAKWHRRVSQVWMTFFVYGIGCSIKISGKANFNPTENYVIVCNHNSMMDVPVTTPFMPRANKTIAKKSLSKIPVFGWIYSFGSVLVDRKNEKSRRESYMQMKRMLSIGLDMVIYPEGTRNRSKDPLKQFYDGAFKLAADCGKPVLPALLFNTKKVLPANKPFYVWPHTLHIHFLPPVASKHISASQLKDEVFNIMWDYYQQKEKTLSK